MATYLRPDGTYTEINPDINPDLVKGLTPVSIPGATEGFGAAKAASLDYAGTPITAATLSPAPSLNLPPTPTEPNYTGTLGSVAALNAALNPSPTPEETKSTDFQNRILELTKKIGGKEQYQAEQDKAFGVTESQNQLRDINNQINALHLEAAGIPSAIQEQFKGRGVTSAGIAPIETGLLRQNTLKALALSAQGQFIQGNILNAKALADRQVQLQFAPAENELKYLQAAYAMNKDILERQDKKRADNLAFQLNERNRVLDNQKENMKIVQGYMMTASKNNPGNNGARLAVQQVSQLDPTASDYVSRAMILLMPYQADPMAIQKDLDAHLKAQAERVLDPLNKQKIEAEIGHIKAQANELNVKAGQEKLSSTLGSTPLENFFEQKIIYLPAEGQKGARKRFNQLLSAGKLKEAENYADEVALRGLPSADRSMVGAAFKVTHLIDRMETQINQAENGLGPIASRWREFKAGKVGFSDPAFVGLRTNAMLFDTLLMRMHVGARGGQQLLDHFKDITSINKFTPQNLTAALEEARKYANDVQSESNFGNNTAQNTGTLPDGTIVTRNADGSITDAKGNKYDENGNKL